jgi:hypothetical protein
MLSLMCIFCSVWPSICSVNVILPIVEGPLAPFLSVILKLHSGTLNNSLGNMQPVDNWLFPLGIYIMWFYVAQTNCFPNKKSKQAVTHLISIEPQLGNLLFYKLKNNLLYFHRHYFLLNIYFNILKI